MLTTPLGLLSSKVTLPVPEYNWWPFLGNTDDVVGGNDGINSGATLTTDKSGDTDSAYLFVRTESDYMLSTSAGNIGTVHSISIRYKPTGYSSIFLTQISSINYLYFFTDTEFRYSNGTGNIVTFTFASKPVAAYHDFVITRNGTSVSLYIDGVQQDTTKILTSNNDFIFDQLTRNAVLFADGVVDDMRIYNRVLSTDEITDLHNLP